MKTTMIFGLRRSATSMALAAILGAGGAGITQAASPTLESSAIALGFNEIVKDTQGAVQAVYGETTLAAHNGPDVEALFRGALALPYGISVNDALKVVDQRTSSEGSTYYRVTQIYKGLPVWGSGLTVQTTASGNVMAIFGNSIRMPDLDVTAKFRSDAQIHVALAKAHGAALLPAHIKYQSEPALFVYAADGRTPVVAWNAHVSYSIAAEEHDERVFVDVKSGELLVAYPQHLGALNRKVHNLNGVCANAIPSPLPGPLAISEGGSSKDSVVNAAYNATGRVYWFFKNSFGRDSYDGLGAQLTSSVRATFGAPCTIGDGAYWDLTLKQMVIGRGGSYFYDLTGNPDVTYHEVGHGVTAATSALIYSSESGAIHEANSDIYAAAISAWMNTVSGEPNASTPMNFAYTTAVWQVGEGLLVGTSNPLRDMTNPASDGISFNDYFDYRDTHEGCVPDGSNDQCGVHTGSGVVNLMFYLLSAGGHNPTHNTTINVNGIGIQRAVKYLYESNVYIIPNNAKFTRLRDAMITRARANGSVGACDEVSIAAAWDAVNVTGMTPANPNACGTTITPDAFEADNTRQTYKALYEGTPHQHNFHNSQDVDWVAFAVGAGVRSTVTLTGSIASNTTVKLYRQLGNTSNPVSLVSTQSNGSGQLVVANDSAASGITIYYVEAKPTTTLVAGASTQYGLSVVVDGLPDSFEPDNTREAYTALYEGTPQTHSFHTVTDQDWVAFAIGPGLTSTVTLQGSAAAAARLDMYRHVNYPNGPIELVSSSAATPGAIAVQHTGGLDESLYVYYVRAMPNAGNAAATESNFTLSVDITE